MSAEFDDMLREEMSYARGYEEGKEQGKLIGYRTAVSDVLDFVPEMHHRERIYRLLGATGE